MKRPSPLRRRKGLVWYTVFHNIPNRRKEEEALAVPAGVFSHSTLMMEFRSL